MAISDLVNDYVQRYTGVLLSSTAVTGEYVDGGTGYMPTGWAPLTAVSEVYDMVEDAAVDTDEYYYTGSGNIVKTIGTWGDGLQRYRISYTAGYSSVPPGLTQAITMIEAEANKITASTGLYKSETNNGYSYTMQDSAVAQAIVIHHGLLDAYRRIVV